MRVLKFGGTSMVDEYSWRRVLNIINRYDHPVVVVSATARTTRQLVAAAETAVIDFHKAEDIASDIFNRHKKIVENFFKHSKHKRKDYFKLRCAQWLDEFYTILDGELSEIYDEKKISEQHRDLIMSFGEELSSFLFTMCGKMENFPMEWIDAHEVIKTDSNYGRAKADIKKIKDGISYIYKKNNKNYIPVMGGFYGQSEKGNTTTLGFEGSDYSASLIGGALNAEAIEIWTDVSGIYTCDPRVVPTADSIAELSFREATELANYGAKVLHPLTMQPALSQNIPIFVKNIFDADHPGTKIHQKAANNGLAKAMAFIKNAIIITVDTSKIKLSDTMLVEIYGTLKAFQESIIASKTEEDSIAVAVKNGDDVEDLVINLKKLASINRIDGQGVISLIGCKTAGVIPIITGQATEVEKAVTDLLSVEPSLIAFNQDSRVLNIAVGEEQLLAEVKQLHNRIFE